MTDGILKLGCAHLQIRADPILENIFGERRHISGDGNCTLVNAKLPSAHTTRGAAAGCGRSGCEPRSRRVSSPASAGPY